MRIRLLSQRTGPPGVFPRTMHDVGDVVDEWPDDDARRLIEAGEAEAADPSDIEPPAPTEAEGTE